jgi:AcrR family transcriptional regulator
MTATAFTRPSFPWRVFWTDRVIPESDNAVHYYRFPDAQDRVEPLLRTPESRFTLGVVTGTKQAQRKDAQRNREAILAAARELFAESPEVAMYEVARRAGVGQATLYRNFPDRRNLAAALLGELMERTERLAAEHAGDSDAFFVLLRDVVDNMARSHALGQLAREDACLGSQLDARRRRLAELLKQPLRDAKAAGTVRCDLTVDDVFLVVSMVKGAVERADGLAGRAAAASRALALVVDGITPARLMRT